MVYPKENRFIAWLLYKYAKWLLNKNFHELLFNNIEIKPDKSVLLLANHFSFWDGIILYYINDRLLKKKFHIMVNEATTYKLYYLRYGGAFSINKKSRNMLTSLNFAATLLTNPNNLVVLFPQGRLYSNFVEDVNFEQGILRVVKKAAGKFQLVLASTFIQYYKHKKQSINVYLKVEDGDFTDKKLNELKEAYQKHYNSAKKLQTEIVL